MAFTRDQYACIPQNDGEHLGILPGVSLRFRIIYWSCARRLCWNSVRYLLLILHGRQGIFALSISSPFILATRTSILSIRMRLLSALPEYINLAKMIVSLVCDMDQERDIYDGTCGLDGLLIHS